jgi:excinuclease ABC subunit A
VKLARELARRATGSTLYVLDEPTTGLHFSDVELLLGSLLAPARTGNTVVIIEHNLDARRELADWVIDLGPDGGGRGGEIVAEGTPEGVAAVEASHTGRFLGPILASVAGAPPARRATPKRPAERAKPADAGGGKVTRPAATTRVRR